MDKKKKKKEKVITPLSENNTISMHTPEKDNYPVFCFKYLSDISIKDNKDNNGNFFFDFLMRLQKLSVLGWNEIRTSSRHSFGMEPIPLSDIIPQIREDSLPSPDVKHLQVFRANGNKLPFVGIRMDRTTFRVLFIETKFGDIYNHGKK